MAAYQNGLDAALIADHAGACVDANPSASELFGVSEADLIGRSIWDFIEPGQSVESARRWQEFLADGSLKGVMRVRRPDGERVDVDCLAKADILASRHLFVLRDITERKRIEEALREADRRAICEYTQLLDRIAALAQALGTARKLPVIFRALQEFSIASGPCSGIFISLYDQKRNVSQVVVRME